MCCRLNPYYPSGCGQFLRIGGLREERKVQFSLLCLRDLHGLLVTSIPNQEKSSGKTQIKSKWTHELFTERAEKVRCSNHQGQKICSNFLEKHQFGTVAKILLIKTM